MSDFLDWLEKGYEKDDIGMPFYSVKELRQAFNAGKQQWISVKDRLPEQRQRVLVSRVAGWPGVDYIYSVIPRVAFYRTSPGNPVTHWMPLPEPPPQDQQ